MSLISGGSILLDSAFKMPAITSRLTGDQIREST
jgi:hypothetical protein